MTNTKEDLDLSNEIPAMKIQLAFLMETVEGMKETIANLLLVADRNAHSIDVAAAAMEKLITILKRENEVE